LKTLGPLGPRASRERVNESQKEGFDSKLSKICHSKRGCKIRIRKLAFPVINASGDGIVFIRNKFKQSLHSGETMQTCK
jgi:hypothetical protein